MSIGPMTKLDAQRWQQTGWVLYRILTDLGYLTNSSEDDLSNDDLDRLRCDLRCAHTERILDRVIDEIDHTTDNSRSVLDRLRHTGTLTTDLEAQIKEDIRCARLIRAEILSRVCTCGQPHGTGKEGM